jgi:hypothetical protein
MTTIHPLVTQLRFTRGEFRRGVRGVSDEDGARGFVPGKQITAAADAWLEEQTTESLLLPITRADGQPGQRIFGSLLQRTIYHYWYHLGENLAIRQLLGHTRLPQFVGDIDGKAPFESWKR